MRKKFKQRRISNKKDAHYEFPELSDIIAVFAGIIIRAANSSESIPVETVDADFEIIEPKQIENGNTDSHRSEF